MSLHATLRMPRTLLFGAGQRAALAGAAGNIGSRALMCTDSRLSATPEFGAMVASLRTAAIEVFVYDRTQPDIPADSVLGCVDAARPFAPDLVIGIGGGSCLDMAKCAALLLAHGGRLQDYYGEFKVPGPILPVVAIPTTAGTGSEASPVAVISDTDRVLKIGISSSHLIPELAICDPDLTMSCPPFLTAAAGADALTHAIEAFTALQRPPDPQLALKHVMVGKSAMSDHFALLAIRLLARSLRRAFDNGADAEARAEVMMAAFAAGCAFGNAGTAAAHAIQYPVGALTHTAHGVGVATMLPYVMEFNRPVRVAEFAEIARIMGVEAPNASEERLSELAIDAVAQLFAAIRIPATLAELGLADDKRQWVADQAIGIARLVKNNPRSLDPELMNALVEAASTGDRRRLAGMALAASA